MQIREAGIASPEMQGSGSRQTRCSVPSHGNCCGRLRQEELEALVEAGIGVAAVRPGLVKPVCFR